MGDDAGVTGVRLKSSVDASTKELDVTGVFIAIGHKPNTDIFTDKLAMKDGYLTLLVVWRVTPLKPVLAVSLPPVMWLTMSIVRQ